MLDFGRLLLVAVFATGRAAIFLVAVFAELVSSILELGCFGAVMAAGAAAGFNTFVVTGGAVSNFGLVSGVGEGHGAHAGFEFDFSRAVVGGNQGGGTKGNKPDGNDNCENAFHGKSPLESDWRQAIPAQICKIYIKT